MLKFWLALNLLIIKVGVSMRITLLSRTLLGISSVLLLFGCTAFRNASVPGGASNDQLASPAPVRAAPAAAAAAGYNINTFSTHTFSISNIDQTQTNNPGYKWYLPHYFNIGTPGPVIINADG